MGQKLSRGNEQVEISLNHTKFVQSRIIKQGEKQTLKTAIPCDEKSYKLWKEVIEKHKSIEHKYLMLPIKNKFKSSAMCTTRGSLEMQFHNYPYLLTDQIHNRKGKKLPFTQPQLWYLLYAYLSVKNYLKTIFDAPYNLIGDVRPDNVFINQNGQVKFSCLLSWPGEKVNYKKTFDGIATYLSPQDYDLLNLGTMNNQANVNSQMFSIGLTLISAATLRENSDIYNVDKLKFDSHQAKKRINTFKCLSIYSELLRGIIASFCQFQPKNRLDFNDLWLWITKYQRRIMTKQPFMIEQIPSKINEHINRLRAQILALQPSSSVLNLTSIRSLKSSQVRAQGFSQLQQERSDVKFLKQADGKELESELQNEKRKSRIVINSGQEHTKVFFSPTNGAYFASKPQYEVSNMIGSPRVYKIDQQRSSGYNRPVLNAGSPQYEGQKVMKSPEGYYSPKSGVNKFRVFIQYKSPSKPIEKPFAETVYLNKQGQQTGVMKVQNMENDMKVGLTKRKNSDTQSQKSGKSNKSNGSNRQNRFIEETIRQSEEKKSQLLKQKEQQQQNIRIVEQKQYKKQSPIHQIINLQNVNQAISEVISQEVLMPRRQRNNNEDQQQKKLEQKQELIKQEDIVDPNTSLNQMVVLNQKFDQQKQQKVQAGLENVPVSEQIGLRIQQQINEMTFDDGKHVVVPESQESQQSNINKSSPFEQIVDEIYPVNLQQANYSTEQIIQNSVSSEKQPQELYSVNNKSHHSQREDNSNNIVVSNNTNDNNILILDQPLEEEGDKIVIEEENKRVQEEDWRSQQINTKEQQQVNTKGEQVNNNKEEQSIKNLQEVTPVILQDRPLIPLGPQTHQHQQQNHNTQIVAKQQQQLIEEQQDKQKKVLSPFEQIQLQHQHQQQQVDNNKLQTKQVTKQIQSTNEVIDNNKQQQEKVNEQSIHQGQQSGFHSSVIAERIQIQPVTVEIKELQMEEETVHQNQNKDINLNDGQLLENIQRQQHVINNQVVVDVKQVIKQVINKQVQVENNHQEQHEDQPQNLNKLQDQDMNLKISYNVIQVQQCEQPLPNDVQKDSQIEGSGISHSLIEGKHQYLTQLLNNNNNNSQLQNEQTNNYDLQLLKYDLINNNGNNNNDNDNDLMVNVQQMTGQKVIVLPKIHVQQQTLRNGNSVQLQDQPIKLQQQQQVQLKQQEETIQLKQQEQPIQLQESPIKLQQQPIQLQVQPINLQQQPINLQQQPIQIPQPNQPQQQQQQYQIVIEDIKQYIKQNEESKQTNKGILPLQSNQKHQIQTSQQNLPEQKIQLQTLKQTNQHELIEAQYSPKKLKQEQKNNYNYQQQELNDHQQQQQQQQQPNNHLHLSDNNNNHLQVSLPNKAQLQSEFGNISEIMDINKEFDNTLNGKQRGLLQGTNDPKSEEMLKQLMNLSQKGIIHQGDLVKVNMSNQDRDKLKNFMKMWQHYDPNHYQTNQVHHYIEQFRQAIASSQQHGNENEQKPLQQQQYQPHYEHQQQQDNRLHMSPQDKEKLRSIVQRLNKNNKNLFEQLQQRILANYDQSHVDIICSQMKTQIIQKIDNLKEQNKEPEDNVKVEEEEQKGKNRLSKHKNDIIDQVLEINNNINKLKSQQQPQKYQQILPLQHQQQILPLQLPFQQQTHVDQNNFQNSQKLSLQANPPTDQLLIQQPSPNIITVVSNPKKQQIQQLHSFNPHISQISQAIAQIQPFIIDQHIQNIEFKQTNGSHVHASMGQRSERDDYIHDDHDIFRSNQHDTTNHDLHILTNHRTQSQPHDIFQRGTLSQDLSPRSNKPGRYFENKDAITQQFLQNDQITDVLAGQCFIQQSENYQVSQNIQPFTLREKDIIDEITEINHKMITTQVKNPIQQSIPEVKETKQVEQQVPVVVNDYPESHIVKVQTIQTKPVPRRRIFRQNDFLDDVMQVNKIVNKEEDKDYYLQNKYLNQHKAKE